MKSIYLIFHRVIYLQVWQGIICLLQVCEWFFVCKGSSYTTAHVLKIKKSSLWRVWSTEKLVQDIFVSKHLSIYPYFLLFKSLAVESSSWKIVVPENICLLFQMLFSRKVFYSSCTSTVCNFTESWGRGVSHSIAVM